MKRTLIFTCFFGAFVAFAGCNFVMAPESPDERAGVSFVIASLSPTDDGSVPRAVVQGAGFLYIRTIGGPSGDAGPCYGPYTVSSGETFRTKDIPPGDFDQILVMHSAKQLFTDATYDVDGKNMTFKEIMSMRDADMIEFIEDDSDGDDSTSRFQTTKDELGAAFEGQACMGFVPKITLRANKTTTLTVTLMPITGAGMDIELEKSPRFTFPKADSLKRGFYRLDGLYEVKTPITAGYLNCKINSLASGSSVGTVAFYDDAGNVVPSTKTGTSVADGLSWRIDTAAANAALKDGTFRLYVYVEYTGEIVSSFVATMPPYVTFGVNGDGSTGWNGNKLLLGIYGDATRDSLATGGSWATQMPVSTAILDLDANGSGLAIFKAGVEAGKNYYFSAQVDVGGHYSSLTNLGSVDLATIIPYTNDYVSKGDPALIAIKVDGLSPFTVGEMVGTKFDGYEKYNSPVYFVSSSGSGANEGSSPSSPKALDSTFLATVPSGTQIYVLDTITDLYGMTVDSKSISIKSYGKSVCQLKAASALSGSLFTVGMGSGSSLALEDIEINASVVSALTMPIINVTPSTGGSLYLGPRSSIRGKPSPSAATAGGVNMYPNTSLKMFGSGIYQCYGSQGSAIVIGMSASADLRYSTFQFNEDGATGTSGTIMNSGYVTAKALSFASNSGSGIDHFPGGGSSWDDE
jgi:hypothetical protein